MKPKTALILILLLVILMAVAVTFGAVGGIGQFKAQDAALSFGSSSGQTLTVDQIRHEPDCQMVTQNPPVWSFSGLCRFTVLESGQAVRKAVLRVLQGSVKVTLHVPAGKRKVDMSFSMEAEDTKDLQFFKDGGSIDLQGSCGVQPCEVRFPR